jgi:filamentous hemagglutinin family protein
MTIQTNSPVSARRGMHCLLALALAACFGATQAAPAQPQVVSGQVSFLQQGNVFSITNSPNAVINWQSFNINAGEITRFIQQSSDSAVLNRIVGQDPSQILGALQSNGHVFLINPNGILFGRDARIDVNGLTASSLALSNADFLAGKNNFSGSATAGQVVNQGSITTPTGGKVFLIAPSVSNSGIITSPQGQVVLAAGHTVQLVDSSNPDLHVVVSAPANQSVNLGQIIAQGGKVGIYGALVNQRGVVNANSAQVGANGKIVLRASRDTMVDAGSVTSATGAGVGGEISVQGERVGVLGNASIDASGAAGGGSVLVGGGYQGSNPLIRNAQQTLFGKNASINADATVSGNGGTVVLWGEAGTRALGRISARGGPLAGNGGLVETSGKYLDVNGIRVDAGARRGANGNWLLDPYDINIVATGGYAPLSDADEFTDLGTGTAYIDAVTFNSVASGTNIKLQATHDVNFMAAINPTLGPAGSLSVDAGNNIQIDAAINTNGGAIKLQANHPLFPSGSGQVAMGANGSIDTGGGTLWMDATQVDLAGPLVTRNGNITINGGNLVSFGQNVATGNGHLTVTANSIQFGGAGTSADTGTGAMIFNNTGGSFVLGSNWTLSTANSVGVYADSMGLQGRIGPSQSMRPTLNLRPYSLGKDFDFSYLRDTSALQLDPAWLTVQDVDALLIGGPNQTGNIHVYSEYNGGLAKKLTFNTSGNISIEKPVLMPSNNGSMLELLISGTNTSGSITTGFNSSDGRLAADNVVLRANNMTLDSNITGTGANGGTVTLVPHLSTAQIHLGVGAVDGPDLLGLSDSELARIFTRTLVIGGNPGQSGAVDVMDGGMDFSSILSANSKLQINAGQGMLNIRGPLTTPGGLFLQGSYIGTDTGAQVKADSIRFSSTEGIGSNGLPFYTQTRYLAAANYKDGGTGLINISNMGTLDLGSVHQLGTGNQGSISISNAGGMTLLEKEPVTLVGVSVMTGGSGNIQLKTQSPLTINGIVSTDAGGISLEAGNGGLLTIGTSGAVISNTGDIGLKAGDILNDGSVLAMNGNISIAATTVTGTGSISAPNGNVVGMPPPTVPQCIADPSITGCTAVLKAALDACVVDPSGPYCASLLPSLASCIADPSIYGCSVVLPPLAACIADPSIAGCIAVLPSLAVCIADKTIPGCSVVLPTLAACIADPSKPGCSVVLPSLAVCIADKTTPGCSVVLPTLAACIADPSKPGCSVVLPSLAVCIADKTTPGCSVVLPTLAACIADPSTPGCSVVLPSLAVCIADKTTPGCSVVLPTLAACIADPSKPGCSVVLPSLAVCIADKTTPGCSVVLPTLAACIADPSKPGCSVVLPSLAVCIADKTTPGCSVVLPTLAVCIADPSTAGCSVVLPSLAVCIADKTTPGCSVVLPTLAACIADPGKPGCSVVLPSLAVCIADKTTPGCSVVLPTLAVCIADPSTAGCSVVLPSLSVCIADKTVAGCSVVLPTLAACIADPTKAGCSVVLPSLSVCIADKTVAGCSVVLPTLASCIADPSKAGCSVVLPSMSVCIADKTVAGCSVVLPTLAACIADPTKAGCSVVLPSMSVCIADKTVAGCSVVLPTLAACIADPGKAGCSVVLPSMSVCIADKTVAGCSVVLPTLAVCVADPNKAGCNVILPTLAACIADPGKAGCSVVLPTVAACVADPSKAGCAVVLPSLSSCIATPTLAGCSVVLPTLSQCVASPTLQGCNVVLPPVDQCVANPTLPLCAVIVPTSNNVIVQVVTTTVQAAPPVSTGPATVSTLPPVPEVKGKATETAKEDKKDDKKDAVVSEKTGVKNDEPVKKMYCN